MAATRAVGRLLKAVALIVDRRSEAVCPSGAVRRLRALRRRSDGAHGRAGWVRSALDLKGTLSAAPVLGLPNRSCPAAETIMRWTAMSIPRRDRLPMPAY